MSEGNRSVVLTDAEISQILLLIERSVSQGWYCGDSKKRWLERCDEIAVKLTRSSPRLSEALIAAISPTQL